MARSRFLYGLVVMVTLTAMQRFVPETPLGIGLFFVAAAVLVRPIVHPTMEAHLIVIGATIGAWIYHLTHEVAPNSPVTNWGGAVVAVLAVTAVIFSLMRRRRNPAGDS